MTKLELIKLARKNGAYVESWGEEGWIVIVEDNCSQYWIKKAKRLPTIIKFLTKNNIKINN